MKGKEADLYDAIYPVYILSKLLGFAQFRIVRIGEIKSVIYERPSVAIIHCIIITSPMAFGIYLTGKTSSNYDVSDLVFLFEVYSCLPLLIIMFAWFFGQRDLLLSSITDIIEVDKVLREIGVTVSYKNARRLAIWEMIFFTFLFLIKAVLQFHNSIQIRVILYTILNVFGYISTIIICQYFNIVFLMRQRYICINRKLKSLRKFINHNETDIEGVMYPFDFLSGKTNKKILEPRTSKTTLLVKDPLCELQLLNKIHNILHNICIKVNRTYSLQLLFILTTRFITIIVQLFNGYKLISNPSKGKRSTVNDVLTVLYLITHASKIFALANIAADTAQKANENIIDLHKICSSRKEIQQEVNNFSVRMLQQNTHFNVCGFFKLDYSLITNIVGATMSYIIILVQYDYNITARLAKIDTTSS